MADVALASQNLALGRYSKHLEQAIDDWTKAGNSARLWRKDKSLWSGADEDRWLGWLDIIDAQLADEAPLKRAANDARAGGTRHVVVLGMGGSSLCPEVLARTFGNAPGFPQLLILDSTVPAQVAALDERLDPATTLFVVASKSGSTIEPNSFKQYFYDRCVKTLGADKAGSRFIAVTDPGTQMERVAKAEGFRAIYYGKPDIGGRFSALSNFGMVPAASSGIDATAFLRAAQTMAKACGSDVSPAENPGVLLGLAIGALAKAGRDKLTIVTSPEVAALGGWLEQLIAESTGKRGIGIVPVDGESPADPALYGDDRLFIYTRLPKAADAKRDAAVAELAKAGHPVVTIELQTIIQLGQEFFRWEIATAVAGAVLGINPFDQPDVESAKVAARSLMQAYESTGKLPEETPFCVDRGLRLFADARNADALRSATGGASDAAAVVKAHLARIGAGDYFGVNAYVEMNAVHDEELQRLRHAVRDAKRVATTVGYGPRFLHSTGQLHKGGPNTGVFLQVTADDDASLPIPGQKYDFGVLKSAQAQGDFAVLAERGRRILRVHLGSDVAAGLKTLRELVAKSV
jgi:transaldolase/glucose-6-phosphate isomerase